MDDLDIYTRTIQDTINEYNNKISSLIVDRIDVFDKLKNNLKIPFIVKNPSSSYNTGLFTFSVQSSK
jgi:hypothetical protein